MFFRKLHQSKTILKQDNQAATSWDILTISCHWCQDPQGHQLHRRLKSILEDNADRALTKTHLNTSSQNQSNTSICYAVLFGNDDRETQSARAQCGAGTGFLCKYGRHGRVLGASRHRGGTGGLAQLKAQCHLGFLYSTPASRECRPLLASPHPISMLYFPKQSVSIFSLISLLLICCGLFYISGSKYFEASDLYKQI